MSDQVPGPDQMLQQQEQPGPQGAPMTPGPPVEEVLGDLLRAVQQAAVKSAGAGDIREVREFGAAALNFSQSYAILHPQILAAQGATPEVVAATNPPRPEPQPKVRTRESRAGE